MAFLGNLPKYGRVDLWEERVDRLTKALRDINGHIGVAPSTSTEAAIRATVAEALGLESGDEFDHVVERDWGDGFESLSCGANCYRYTDPSGVAEEVHGTFDGRGCQGPTARAEVA